MTEWILSSSILILVVIILRTVFKGRISLRLQYAIWGLVLLRLLIPVSFGSSNISVENLSSNIQKQPVAQVISDLGNLSIPTQSYEHAYQKVIEEYEAAWIDVDHLEGSELEALEYEAYDKMEGKTISEIIGELALLIWIMGIVLVGIVFVTTNTRFRKRIMSSRYALGVQKNRLDVYATEMIDTPCLFGLKNPAIYVTYPVADHQTLLRHTVEHEATHHRHGDHIWSVLRCVCLAVHWYNPLVWWAAILSQRDGELACDEATIKALGEGERAEYGRTLIGMTCQKKANVLITATTMTASKSGIKERIMLIAKKPRMAVYTLITVLLIASVAVGCTFTGAKNDPIDAHEYLEEYAYKRVMERMDREDVRVIGGGYDYALVYCQGEGPALILYRYEQRGGEIIVTEEAFGEYALSGGLSVNYIVDDGKYIYFGTISDSHWVPEEDTQIPLEWNVLVFFDDEGNQKIVNLGSHGYLCVMDEPAADFWVAAKDGSVPLTMEQYLEQGYTVNEVQWGNSDDLGYASPTEEDTRGREDILNEQGEMPVGTESPEEVFTKELEENQIAIAVLPTDLAVEGGGYYYIVPEEQDMLLEYFQAARASGHEYNKWDSSNRRTGWWIVYQGRWWQVMESGAMYGVDEETLNGICIEPEDAKRLYEFCDKAVKDAGVGEPVRPEDIRGIKSATLHWNGVHTVTNPYALRKIEEWFANSTEEASVACWFTARLVLELENGETKTLCMATDSCATWMSEGAMYSYGETTNVGVEGSEEFYSLFATEMIHEKSKEGPDAMADYWIYVNWRMYGEQYSIDETFALMDMFKEYAVAHPTETMVRIALTTARGLDGAFAQYYAGVVAALYEADPAVFRFACRQMIPEEDVNVAVNMLAFYWVMTLAEAQEMLGVSGN